MFFNAEKEDQNECFHQINGYLLHEVGIDFDYNLECSEKYKSFKLTIPQPDSERRHSPDFRTVFGIMIGPFSFCKIGKT